MSNPICEVAILGAGPYGLSVASHLRRAGVETLIFGRPMEFWRHQMPRGMLLRSSKRASSIGSPIAGRRLEDYGSAAGIDVGERVRLEDFANYGDWFLRNEVGDVDHRNITELRASSNGFTLVLEDGEQVETRRVVVAAGIGPFAHRPPQFDGLPEDLASHSSDHAEFSKFAGTKVIVLGAGKAHSSRPRFWPKVAPRLRFSCVHRRFDGLRVRVSTETGMQFTLFSIPKLRWAHWGLIMSSLIRVFSANFPTTFKSI